MYKVYYQGDQDDLLAQCAGVFNQYIPTDGLYKQAASSCFSAADIAEHKPDKDHFLMHIVAMGAHPRYLPNRNGDAFTKEALHKSHDTFVKSAKLFREHQHHDASKNLGFVKASAYNEDLDRVELLVHGNKDRAPDVYEAAKKGKELSYSMAAKLASDVCSCCGNAAKSQEDYCDHLKHKMNQYIPEFRKYAFAFNPEPRFFDISVVRRPADRIAHYLEYVFGGDGDAMTKAASEQEKGRLVIPGTEWAKYAGYEEGAAFPEDFANLLTKLAKLEGEIDRLDNSTDHTPEAMFINGVVKRANCQAASEIPSPLLDLPPSVFFRKLANEEVILPFDAFCAYIKGVSRVDIQNDEDFIKAASELPTMFRTMAKTPVTHELVKLANEFIPSSRWAEEALLYDRGQMSRAMEDMAIEYSASLPAIQHRALYNTTPVEFKKVASAQDISPLTYAYGCYQTMSLLHSDNQEASTLFVLGSNRF